MPREPYGAPTTTFFARVPAHLKPITEALRALIVEAAPDAKSQIKWGIPFFGFGSAMKANMCAVSVHKAHVNLALFGPKGSFADPHGRLTGKAGSMLQLRELGDLPRTEVKRWLRKAAALARVHA